MRDGKSAAVGENLGASSDKFLLGVCGLVTVAGLILLGFTRSAAGGPDRFPASIQIINPTNGACFQFGDSIRLCARVNGFVWKPVQVRYFDGSALIGSSSAPNFTFVWRNACPGLHSIVASLAAEGAICATSPPVQIVVAPPNASFDHATILRGSMVTVEGSPVGSPSNSVWYRWKAPAFGRVELSMPNWPYGTYVGVYTGTAISNLVLAADDLAPDGSGWYTRFEFPVIAGTNYFINVSGNSAFTLAWEFHRPPSNDSFQNRMVIPSFGGTSIVNNLAATFQPGEPSDGLLPSERTVWWTWTAPGAGEVCFQPEDDFGTLLGIYQGTIISNLVVVAQTQNSPVTLNVAGGTTFQISVDGLDGQSGEVRLRTLFTLVPANDDFAHASKASGVFATIRGNNTAATYEAGEPIHDGLGNGGSVWYEWSAPVSGYVRLSPTAGSASPVIAVYTGAVVSNLTAVASTNNGTLGFEAVKGSTYHIAVDGANGWQGAFEITLSESTLRLIQPSPGAGFYVGQPIVISAGGMALAEGGSSIDFFVDTNFLASSPRRVPSVTWTNAQLGYYTLTAATTERNGFTQISEPVPIHVGPPNDNFTNAIVLEGLSVSVIGNNYGAGSEPGEPVVGDPTADASVWYSWTAPAFGMVSVSIDEDSFAGHDYGVCLGTSVSNLTVLGASIYDFYPVTFVGLAGTTYYIDVSGFSGNVPDGAGPFTLNVEQTPGPPNDFFADRIQLSGTSVQVTGSNINATVEAGEPDAGGPSVWWTWTAPATGVLSVNASGNGLGPGLTFFTGNSISNLQYVAGLGPSWYYGTDTSGEVPVEAGTAYQIRLTGSYCWPAGTVVMNLAFAAAPGNDDFASRTELNGPSIATTNLIGTATEEPGEPNYNFTGQSIWWSWTATNSLETMIIAEGTCGAPALSVYTGNSLDGLAVVTNGVGALTFAPASGVTYQIEASQNSCDNTNATVYLALQSGIPANDNFAQRAQLNGSNIMIRGSTILATGEVGEPIQSGSQGSNSVWWCWTAPATGTLSISVIGDDGFNPTWCIYVGTAVDALSPLLNCDSGLYGAYTTSGIVPVTAGATYHIQVNGSAQGTGGMLGDFSLGLAFNGPPANDNFTNSIPITSPAATVTGISVLATKEPGEPDHDGYEGGHSLWWSFTAPASGWLELNAQGSSTITLVAVYTGSSLTNLVSVAGGNASFAPVEFNVTAGTTYKIATDYWYSDMSGLVVLNLLYETLELITPTNGADFYGITPLNLTAEVTDADGPFTELDFLADGAVIGAVTNPPFALTWNNPTLGGHTLNVQLVNSNLVTRVSPGVGITIHPVNDNFEARTVIAGNSVTLDAQGIGATVEPGEPALGPIFYQSLWWTWTAPSAGTVTLSKPADLDNRYLMLGVYTGSALTNLVLVTNTPENGSGTLLSELTFEAQPSLTYQITVGGSFLYLSDLPVTFTFTPLPNNQSMSVINDQEVTLSDPPSLNYPARLSATEFGFNLSGESGSNYTVVFSSDLSQAISNWTPLLTTNLSGNSVFILDHWATNSQRFYRIKARP